MTLKPSFSTAASVAAAVRHMPAPPDRWLLTGGGIVCYANSFLLTDVIRALLLFYLTPVWATLIEVFVLRAPPGWRRAITLPMSLAGVWIVIAPVLAAFTI